MLRPSVRKNGKFENPVPTALGGLGLMLKVMRLYISNREERVPVHRLGPFRTDPRVYEVPPSDGLRVTWLGHSAMLVEIDGVRVLLDPMLDERASPLPGVGPKRFYPSPLPLEEMPDLDAVLISHDHYDHLGERTVRALARLPAAANARWVTPLGVGRILQRFGVRRERITALDWMQAATVRSARTGDSLQMTALPARHFSGRGLKRFGTLWCSFALRGRDHAVYFGADSGLWDGFAEIGREFGPFDLTMLDTGASDPLWRDIHMGPEGAAAAFGAMGGRGLLMPIHWGLFDLALHSWRQPMLRMTELAEEQGIGLWSPEPGLPSQVLAGQELRSDWWRAR